VSERLKDNITILRLLEEYLRHYPDMRFGQALVNLNIVEKDKDPFYDEPASTLERMITFKGGK
jgi:hypothetical protein